VEFSKNNKFYNIRKEIKKQILFLNCFKAKIKDKYDIEIFKQIKKRSKSNTVELKPKNSCFFFKVIIYLKTKKLTICLA
jgi:hypothetical protein